jgi:hypothetical protein
MERDTFSRFKVQTLTLILALTLTLSLKADGA